MRTCPTCKQRFQPQTKNQRFCWYGSCRDRKLGRVRVKAKTTTEAGRGHSYQKIRPYVLRRDNWTCQMPVCLAPTRALWREAPRMHPWSPSVDHIVRPCDGGHPSDPANLRASHLRCNSSAGAITGNRQRGQRYTSSAPRIAR
jgi:5-methylcytosine-specific restriction endonuclease McrA